MHNSAQNVRRHLVVFLVAFFSANSLANSQTPHVVELFPQNEAEDVDPATREMRIKFDQDMDTSGYSLCGGGDNFPEILETPEWVDDRTVVIKVKLKRDHDYRLSINCPSAQNFRSAGGAPLEPVPWSFSTAAKSQKRSRAKQKKQNARCLDELMNAIRNDYSYRDLRDIDWKALEKKHRKKIRSAKSVRTWVKRVAKMLAGAQDMHIWIEYKKKTTPTFIRRIETNFNLEGIKAALPNFKQRNACVYTAKTEDDVGYILIGTLANNRRKQLEEVQQILEEFKACKALILDLRPNGGGNEELAMPIAAWFVEGEKTYAKNDYRDKKSKSGFGPTLSRKITGNKPPRRFDKPVAVLMGPSNMSSCEAFILMLDQADNVTLIGGKSYGSSGNPKPHTLDNGVTIFLPSWRAMRPDGSCFEGEGLKPDITVDVKPEELKKGDPIIDRALRSLRIRM